jgi:hypothetical protein
MMDRRSFVAGLAAIASPIPLWSSEAVASTAYGLTTEELVRRSARVSLGRSVERTTSFMDLAGARRIVTVHRIIEVERIDSDEAPEESWVLTLGGRMGDLGQKVSGEAEIRDGDDFVLFLGRETEASPSVPPYRRVIGMAQGAYGLVNESGRRRLHPARNLPNLVRPPAGKMAIEAFRGVELEACKAEVRRFK